MTDFACADTHFNHLKILEYGRAKIADTIEEHTEVLIKNWNSVVTYADTTYLLGDVCFQGIENVKHIGRLNGKKILIAGNHDCKKAYKPEFAKYFDQIESCFEYRKRKWLFTHYPVHPYIIDGERYELNVHGHMHAGYIRCHRLSEIEDHRYMCVSMDRINFTPISVDEISSDLKRRHQTNN